MLTYVDILSGVDYGDTLSGVDYGVLRPTQHRLLRTVRRLNTRLYTTNETR